MHFAIVFSTSKLLETGNYSFADNHDATEWLSSLASFFTFLQPIGSAYWLDPGYAAEIICEPDVNFTSLHINKNATFQSLRKAAASRQLDVNIVPAIGRQKRLLIADMDSTVITSESLDDLAEMIGIGDAINAITKRSMAGAIDFEDALTERVAMLSGHSSQLFDTVVTEAKLTPGAIVLVKTMRQMGAKCYLVSGGFDFITRPVAALCGFHDYHANHMNVDNGKILGTVRLPVLDREAKANYLNYYCKVHGITLSDAATIGDGANDLAMLQAAGMGVAFKGTPLLRDMIGIQLNYTDLRGLLYLQGYGKNDFISAYSNNKKG